MEMDRKRALKQRIWMFPEIGVPSVLINVDGIFHYKPSIINHPLGGTTIYGNPRMNQDSINIPSIFHQYLSIYQYISQYVSQYISQYIPMIPAFFRVAPTYVWANDGPKAVIFMYFCI
jgi:hypothetical protein